MPDDWSWFWAGESGRDSLLRDEIEGLAGQASQARAQSARLSSQLANLQGSLSTRLDALASAFDAYVELGDVREQLGAFAETATIRRDASFALTALGRGEHPDPIDDRGQRYWLSAATNALIALIADQPDTEQMEQARAWSPEAEIFVVSAAGALGHGVRVADRVVPLLVSDGRWSEDQLALWRGVVAGQFGEVVDAVLDTSPAAVDATDWVDWLSAQARSRQPVEMLTWLGLLVDAPEAAAPPTDDASARTDLQATAKRQLDRGLGNEAELLLRARALRLRIEDPQAARTAPDQADEDVSSTPIVEVFRAAMTTGQPGAPLARRLIAWAAPGLAVAVEALAEQAARPAPDPEVRVDTPGGAVAVGPAGLSPEQVARKEQTLVEIWRVPQRKVTLPVVGLGILVVLLIIGLVTGTTALSVLAVIGIGITAVLSLAALRARLAGERELAAGRADLLQTVSGAQRRAIEQREKQRDAAAETARRATSLLTRLREPG